MAVDKRLVLTYAFTNVLFIAAGVITLIISLMWRMDALNSPTTGSIQQNVIFMMTPNVGGMAVGIITIVAGVLAIPALVMPTSRGWLYTHGWAVTGACVALLVLGLRIWFVTLTEQSNILDAWVATSPNTLADLEEQFNCCGYWNSTSPPFVLSANACPNADVAATKLGCIITLQPYADLFLNRIFTTLFGFVGIGTCAILAGAMLVKARTTEARYVRIAQKGIL